MDKITQGLILACWIVFLTYWLLSALSTKKTAERVSWGGAIAHRMPIILGVLLLARPIPLFPFNALVVPHTPVTDALAVTCCVLGLLGAIWSRRTLAKNWSSEVVFKEQHELVERGPYRWVRHPIYTSILLMILGSALAIGRLASFVGVLLFVAGFVIKLRLEESLLLRHFHDEYEAYKSHVKALIPFVW